MPIFDMGHDAGHVLVELLAAIVLIGGGLVVLGLAFRRNRRGGASPVVVIPPADPARSVRQTLILGACMVAASGAAAALAPLSRWGLHADATAFGGAVGVALGSVALVLLAVARFGVPRLATAGVLRLRSTISIGFVPLVTLAVIAVVVVLAVPTSGAPTLHH